ncbi:MAG: dipeptidase [Nocardioidaceae bacterium]|nr:MAG: dipeptidase [Nocardioidaceae bacterium]
MTILLSDPRLIAVPVADNDEPLVRLGPDFGPARALVRLGLAARLEQARNRLPVGIGMLVVEGYRTPAAQQAIIDQYSADLRRRHPQARHAEIEQLTSRFVAPLEVAPHVAGAAVDLTLFDVCGDELDMGTPVDATPEASQGRCYFAAGDISPDARAHRDLLAAALGAAGLVNYPTEWWHWSYGDRYWALLSGEPAAIYGPVAMPSTSWELARQGVA